jgi:hypothetical protein
MEHIAHRIADIARNIEIVGADSVTLHGFTQVPNFVLVKKYISVGAKLAYAMLLKYAWGDNACFPGQLKLTEDMGAWERIIRTYLKELEAAGILEIKQRGPVHIGPNNPGTSPAPGWTVSQDKTAAVWDKGFKNFLNAPADLATVLNIIT